MKYFGINQVGIPKHQAGTIKGGLQPRNYSGTWGNRGQGNELQSALENGLSWIGDKVMNFGDYVEDGLAYVVGSIPGGKFNAEQAIENNRLRREAKNNGDIGYTDVSRDFHLFPITGVVPVLPSLPTGATSEVLNLHNKLKKLRFNWQVRESQLKKLNQLDKIESTATAKKYRETEKMYNDAIRALSKPTKKQTSAFKAEKARSNNDLRAYNQGRPVLRARQWDYVEELMRKDPKMAGVINRYDIKVAKELDPRRLREAKKEMLWNYAKSRKDLEYIIKHYE